MPIFTIIDVDGDVRNIEADNLAQAQNLPFVARVYELRPKVKPIKKFIKQWSKQLQDAIRSIDVYVKVAKLSLPREQHDTLNLIIKNIQDLSHLSSSIKKGETGNIKRFGQNAANSQLLNDIRYNLEKIKAYLAGDAKSIDSSRADAEDSIAQDENLMTFKNIPMLRHKLTGLKDNLRKMMSVVNLIGEKNGPKSASVLYQMTSVEYERLVEYLTFLEKYVKSANHVLNTILRKGDSVFSLEKTASDVAKDIAGIMNNINIHIYQGTGNFYEVLHKLYRETDTFPPSSDDIESLNRISYYIRYNIDELINDRVINYVTDEMPVIVKNYLAVLTNESRSS